MEPVDKVGPLHMAKPVNALEHQDMTKTWHTVEPRDTGKPRDTIETWDMVEFRDTLEAQDTVEKQDTAESQVADQVMMEPISGPKGSSTDVNMN